MVRRGGGSTLYPPANGLPSGDLDFLASLRSELSGYHAGTFRNGLLLPESAPQLPAPPLNLVSDLESGNYGRINRRAYSAESLINLIEHTPQSDRYVFDMTHPSEIEFSPCITPAGTQHQRWRREINLRRGLIPSQSPTTAS
jgi:hypothetical protein